MGDNVFSKNDKAEKPADQASAAYLEAQKRLAEAHVSLTGVPTLNFGASAEPSSLKTQIALADAKQTSKPKASTPGEAAAVINNNPLHLTGLAITSIAKGAWEPLAGGIQFTEQVANAATLNLPGVHKAYLSPEKLSPTPSAPAPEYVKYSPEWFISTAGESVGKLPWYYLAGKAMAKVPGFGEGAGALSESSMLGMNVKSAAASGFIVGALSPTDVQKDGSLTTALENRGIQGTIGAGQMALMTAGTALVGKGMTVGEKALLGKESAATEETLVGITQKSFLKTSTQATLQFLKRGTIASVGSIPAGLAAGYANAKITGTKFDATENLVSTATIGFGLGGINFGKAEAPKARTADAPAARTAEASVKATTAPLETAPENSSSPITARARARITELAEKARAALVGGAPETAFAFNSNDGVPDDAPAKKETTGDKPAAGDDATKGTSDKTAPAGEAPEAKEKTFKADLGTSEQLAKYQEVFDSLMKASKKDGTSADEAKFVEAAVKEPWTIRQLREHLAAQDVKSDHVNGLLDRADAAVKDNAMTTAKVPPYARASFSQGYDLLHDIANAREPKQLDDGIKALRSFVMDGDTVLAAKNQLRSQASKLGGPELVKEFDNAIERRYPIAMVHQLPTDQTGRPPNKGEFTEVRSTQAAQFKSIVVQARAIVEGNAGKASGEGTADAQAAAEHPYVTLREMGQNLDPDLKASLINYASKTNDVRFRALINDVLSNPNGEDLPNRPIKLPYNASLEPAWDKIERRLAAHPKPDAEGQPPSPEAVAKYRDSVFTALNHYEQTNPGVSKLAQMYALQTNNSFEASALDYYFGTERLSAFPAVREARIEAKDATESRNSFVPKISAPEPVSLETGSMNSDYFERIKDRLGDKNARAVRPFNGGKPLEKLLDEAPKRFTDYGVTRGVFSDRADGLVKVTSMPDNRSGLPGGRHVQAQYENSPEGTMQIDDYADGTRWIREKKGDWPETESVFYANGTEATYASPDVWSVDFPNGNYIYSYPENEQGIAREIRENGVVTQVLKDGTTKVLEATTPEEPTEQTQSPAQITVDTLLEQMKSAQAEKGRIAAAETLKSQIGNMDDSQFKAWLDFIRETPNEANARPPYMKMSGMRSMHGIFESGILDNPETLKAFKSYLEVPEPGQFKLAYPRSMQEITVDQMTPALSNDVRARFSAQAADGTPIFAPDLPAGLQHEFSNTDAHVIKDQYGNVAAELAPDNLATRLNALTDLGSFKPATASRLLELGAQDPRALADVMKFIKEPRNDIPAVKTLLAETIPNADDIYTVKVMLDSIDAARKAFKSPEIQEANRNVAIATLADLTGDVAQDVRLGQKIDEIIKTKTGGKGVQIPETSNLPANLAFSSRTKVDPAATPAEAPEQDAASGDKTPTENVSTNATPADASQTGNGDTTAKQEIEEAPPAPPEPVKTVVENLVDKLNSSDPYSEKLAAADALKGQLGSMDDAQFKAWVEFARQDSQEANSRPNSIKLGLRGLDDVFSSNMLDDPAAAKALQDYLTMPAAGEFKLAYPDVLKTMSIAEMPATLLNDIRARFSAKGPTGLVFQDDVPQAMRDYLTNNQRIKVDRDRAVAPDTLSARAAIAGQLSAFQPDIAGRLLELGAQNPSALADVVTFMKQPRNDYTPIRNLLAETIPNTDNIYTLRTLLDSIDKARNAWRSEELPLREANTAVALRTISELTGDTAQDKRLSKDVPTIVQIRSFDPKVKEKPSTMPDKLSMAARTKPAEPALNQQQPAAAASAPPAEALQTSAAPGNEPELHEKPAALEEPAALEPLVEPKRDLTPEELTELSELIQERLAQQFGSVENAIDGLTPAAAAPPEPAGPEATVQAMTNALEAPVQTVQPIPTPEAENTGTGNGGTGSGSSQMQKFARRQSGTQRAQERSKPGSGSADQTGARTGKPKQTFTSLADLGKMNFKAPPTDANETDAAVDKVLNTAKHNRREQSRKINQEKQDRRDGGDGDN